MKKELEVFEQEYYPDGGMKRSNQVKEKEDDGMLEFSRIACVLVFIVLSFFTINKLLDARTQIQERGSRELSSRELSSRELSSREQGKQLDGDTKPIGQRVGVS